MRSPGIARQGILRCAFAGGGACRVKNAMPPLREDDLPITIYSGSEKPEDTYAAIEYRGHWFWIDDKDFQSKRVFTFLMIMLSLAETGSTPAAPLLTVGTGG